MKTTQNTSSTYSLCKICGETIDDSEVFNHRDQTGHTEFKPETPTEDELTQDEINDFKDAQFEAAYDQMEIDCYEALQEETKKVISKLKGLELYKNRFDKLAKDMTETILTELNLKIKVTTPYNNDTQVISTTEKDNCPECNKPYNSEYHLSDECVNLSEDKNENKS